LGIGVEPDFEVFAGADGVDVAEAELLQGALDGEALGVVDGALKGDVDLCSISFDASVPIGRGRR
jgi:hypothetical protein